MWGSLIRLNQQVYCQVGFNLQGICVGNLMHLSKKKDVQLP